MRKMISLLLVLFMTGTVFSAGAFEGNEFEAKFTYRPNTKTFIPASYEMNGKISIDAPVGDGSHQSPVIQININNQGPFLFMFDTGFSETIFSMELIKKLNLKKSMTKKQTAITPTKVVEHVRDIYLIDEIKIGGVVIKDYAILSDEVIKNDPENKKSYHIDGILSANAFYNLLLIIDYQKEKINLEEGDLRLEPKNQVIYLENFSVPMVKAKIRFDKLKKEVDQNFILDTGCSSYFVVNACHLPEILKFTGKEMILTHDYLENQNAVHFAQLFGSVIFPNNYTIQSPYMIFSFVHCELKNPKGLIGRTFFEKNKVTIDQKNGLVKIEKY